jgi:peptidoglycan hydrolase CwlO-like protein
VPPGRSQGKTEKKMIFHKIKPFAVKEILILLFGLVVLLNFFIFPVNLYAETQEEKLQRLQNEIEQYQKEIGKLQAQANTLSNQIAQYNAQINLATLKIVETEEKISLLGGRIDLIQNSVDSLTSAFNERVSTTYKMTRLGEPVAMIVTAADLNGAFSSFHYLKRIQQADTELLKRLENTKDVYNTQKRQQEELQDELKIQKESLDAQKRAKDNLLVVTKNDERRYQDLLATARAEYEAIQAIIAGKGVETEVGAVSEGARIASIIQGPSCNSSGAHLHFIVSEGGIAKNPFNYLRGGVTYENCSGSSCGSSDGDSFNPSGSWIWPISEPIKFTQGYGSTWATRNTWVGRIYNFHNGIDISSPSPEVKAVESGTLFRGSYSGSGGCSLRYVRVAHENSNLNTFYLHINY